MNLYLQSIWDIFVWLNAIVTQNLIKLYTLSNTKIIDVESHYKHHQYNTHSHVYNGKVLLLTQSCFKNIFIVVHPTTLSPIWTHWW
jgi:hypothetical protein